MSHASESCTGWIGESVNALCTLTLGCVTVFGVACASQRESEKTPDSVSRGSPIVREGIVYTPMSVGPQGCVLYNIRIPGGQAPAALAYQNTEGRFSYERPDRCVTEVEAQ